MTEKVIILDASEFMIFLRRTGSGENPVQGLTALVNRGDRFFFPEDFQRELVKANEWNSPRGKILQRWIEENSDRIVKVDPVVGEDEKEFFDPDNRRAKTGGEIADMSIRKFMWQNRDRYDFEVISSDIGLLNNRFETPSDLHQLEFDRLSTRSALTWLTAHPDVPFTRDKFTALRERILTGRFDLSEKGEITTHPLEKHKYALPESFEHAQSLRVGKHATSLFRKGAPVVVLGLAAVPIYSIVKARAEERNISFAQAAREAGLDFTEDDLKSLAADVGVDLAISLTPVGVLKKAWDVLGNIDDIVAVTQLYGEAYPDNQVIQELAGLGRIVEASETFQGYVYGRDALTGAVGGVIDTILGSGEDDEQTAAALAQLSTSLQEGGAAQRAANSGATQAELAETLSADVRRRMAEQKSLFGAEPVARADAPLSAPRPDSGLLSPESTLGDGTSRDGQRMPLEEAPMLPGSAAILPPEFVREGDAAAGSPAAGADQGEAAVQAGAPEGVPVPRSRPGEEPVVPGAGTDEPGMAPQQPARKTSYDTYRKLGRTPEEESQAMADYRALYRKSYLEVGGDEELADRVAAEWFKLDWGLSDFAPDAEGTVMKHPAEKVYPDLEKDGRGYVRKEVETLLTKQGVKASKWYLSPNGKTGADFREAPMDKTGFGPRMSLTVEDEAGGRFEVTDSFQADMASARQRFLAARLKKDREEAVRYGIEVPPADAVRPQVRLERPAAIPGRNASDELKPRPRT